MGKRIEFQLAKRCPTYKEVKRKRLQHNLTKEQAAQYVYTNLRAWEYYESNERRMPKSKWELFLNKCELFD